MSNYERKLTNKTIAGSQHLYASIVKTKERPERLVCYNKSCIDNIFIILNIKVSGVFFLVLI